MIGILIFFIFCYLALYSWNARTKALDKLAERSGLEIVGSILSPITWAKESIQNSWQKYLALIGVAEENVRLKEELHKMRVMENLFIEEQQELYRLRDLLRLEPLRVMPSFGARVIANRFGPQAALRTLTIDKGFLDGAVVGAPVVVSEGIVGDVLRASPHTSTVLLLTDPGFKVAVISQQTRTPGIVTGSASSVQPYELTVGYVAQNAKLKEGEILITAGVDGLFPKGIPVGRVVSVQPSQETLFQQVQAMPFVLSESLEEIVVLQPSEKAPPILPPLVGPPKPFFLNES